MITDDLCAPTFTHHQAPAVHATAPRTRIAFVRFDDVRMDKACTTATGFVVAVLIPAPREDGYTPATVEIQLEPTPMPDAPSAPSWSTPGVSTPPFVAGIPATPSPAPSAIPEPSTWALLLAGFGMIGLALRRRRLA